jgi:hypothetical protein
MLLPTGGGSPHAAGWLQAPLGASVAAHSLRRGGQHAKGAIDHRMLRLVIGRVCNTGIIRVGLHGTYQLVSSTKVSATYTTRGGQTGSCPDRNPGPLTIVQDRVQYTSATGRHFEGTVSPQGRLLLNRIEFGNMLMFPKRALGTFVVIPS